MIANSNTSEDQMLVFRSGKVANVVFNNPARHNAMTVYMWCRLTELMNEFSSDGDLRVIVLSGAGNKAFVSGADISEFETKRSGANATASYDRIVAEADNAVAECPKPTIAKINGYCFGGGLGLALGCDIRICGESAKFCMPAAKLGLGYGFGGSKKLVDAVGPANAAELFYTARTYDAQDALRMGLVNQVIADDELADAANALAERIAGNAPLTQMTFKAAMRECLKVEGKPDRDHIRRLAAACFASSDYVEGRKAFLEKRKPIFKGK